MAKPNRYIDQPLEELHENEALKNGSDFLRGSIAESLADDVTGSVCEDDGNLLKFHGIYEQDDRDLRDERRRQKLERAYQFMVRVRLPGGVLTPVQWLKLDEIAREQADGSLRLTTRQTFQFHGVLKRNLRAAIQQLDQALLDTIAACGDDTRGVMCSVDPALSSLHREIYDLAVKASDSLIPRTGAYREIWLDGERITETAQEEPLYGSTYLPRKFKIGFVLPPVNDIDVYTQDLGFIAIVEDGSLVGFNICVGGGMGRTDNVKTTFPRLADVIGFAPKDLTLSVAEHTVAIQRDFGNRVDRSRARFKYTIDENGVDWFLRELETRLGGKLEPARPYTFETNGDVYGWQIGEDGRRHFTLFVENGRISNQDGRPLLDGLRALAETHLGEFRVTPNQNLVVANVPDEEVSRIGDILGSFGLDTGKASTLRRNAMACVALPTCGLAMAESERYLPELITKIEVLLSQAGLDDEAITVRMTGCPNGCARPYVGEIAFTGRAPGKYNMYLGGGFFGQRLNRLYLANVAEDRILAELGEIIPRYAAERRDGERFGDFVIRAGYVRQTLSGQDFNNDETVEGADV